MFNWCRTGQHDICHREYKVHFIDNKGKVVYTGDVRKCECDNKDCACFVKRADRKKTRARRRK